MDLVSIIIPNFNYSRYLKEAIKSLIHQTYERLELIFIDDGSDDDSWNTAEFLKYSYHKRFERFTTIKNDENQGICQTLNTAIPLVKGDITLILDSDDYLDKNFIQKTLEYMGNGRCQNKRTAFVYTDCWLIDSDGNRLGRGKCNYFDKDLLKTCSYIPGCAPVKTSVLQSVLPFDVSIKVGTKHHRWKRIVEAGWEGHYLKIPLFYYRLHDRNISGIGGKIMNDAVKTPSRIFTLSGYLITVGKK